MNQTAERRERPGTRATCRAAGRLGRRRRSGNQPQARVSYAAMYPDGVGRNQAVAEYGTNGDAPFTRPATIPATSDTVLVTRTFYNDRGEPYQSVDPLGTVTQTTLDDAGRRTELIRNFQQGQPSTGDMNVAVQWTYTADSLAATMKALNSATGDQTTTWNYGVTMPSSDVARNDVLAATVYADGGVVSYLVNRQSERKQLTDQNGTVHVFDRDLLRREINDRVVTLGTGIDGTVQRIGQSYDVRGLLQSVTSYSSPVVGQGVVVNDVQRLYNSFEQLVTEYQEHSGAVNPATSVSVGYQYDDASANVIRQTAIVYPSGRVVTLSYGTTGGMDDALSRVASIIDQDGTHLVDYTRIGAETFVQQSSPQPRIAWSLINGTGIDPYTGLDRFNQVVDNRWYSTVANTDLDRIQNGYDLAGNRLYRKNTVAEAAGVYLDELYAYDGLYRLARLNRGQLNSSNSGIVSGTEDFTQAWGLDSTGNWSTFDQADTGGAWTLQQNRTANPVNEITGITGGGWVVPAYDAAGNMAQMPQPASPTNGYSAVYDAWSRMIVLSVGGSAVQTNAYDGGNRRTTRLVSSTLRHFYFSLRWQSLEERLGASTSSDRQFIWGLRYIDDLTLRDRGNERLYALQDPNWNATAVVSAGGSALERYLYGAYGGPRFMNSVFTAQPASAYDWETLFAGYERDASSALYQVRRRILHSVLAGWLTRDPIDFDEVQARRLATVAISAPQKTSVRPGHPEFIRVSGSKMVQDDYLRAYMDLVNRYSYVTDNPIDFVDPTGLRGGPWVVLCIVSCGLCEYAIGDAIDTIAANCWGLQNPALGNCIDRNVIAWWNGLGLAGQTALVAACLGCTVQAYMFCKPPNVQKCIEIFTAITAIVIAVG